MTSWQNIDTFNHELGRVTSMTDEQLNARYRKMTKPEKIEAFYRALIQENRNSSLQKQISKDHGLFTVTSWVLIRHRPNAGNPPSKDTWKFRTHDPHNIQIFHNDDVWQDEYVNGYYPPAKARTLWNKLVDKGYKRQVA